MVGVGPTEDSWDISPKNKREVSTHTNVREDAHLHIDKGPFTLGGFPAVSARSAVLYRRHVAFILGGKPAGKLSASRK